MNILPAYMLTRFLFDVEIQLMKGNAQLILRDVSLKSILGV